jgi:hypothetical protein
MGWIIAAQGLTLVLVSIGLIAGAAWELATGERDPLVVSGFLFFFVFTLLGGAWMAWRNWPKGDEQGSSGPPPPQA